ncbi:hypothetical protein BDU57DRAFT_317091 [Ampelomyces quisqualis]|uniref:Uncharacterized protein n=1 Tax=Ampelomyces quisqualis TaxID=50730 RepID=A0A6A5QE29_AMPQU|nr:hypothetical protein BDU57DRAFT_317091 [Ampelomyces quisqualis]
MHTAMGILDLADELLRIILEHVASEPEKLISLDRRAYLSQESFKLYSPPEPDQAENIESLRLTCKRFSDLGAIHQFARLTVRFSKRSFTRLERVANKPHLARRVKKLSYMVPFFYVEGREKVQDLLPTLPNSLGLDIRHLVQKVNEQKDIVKTREDARVLTLAITAFTSLQHVQLLRVQDEEDSYIRGHAEFNHLVELKWPPACLHCTKTIGSALITASSPCTRFSSPMLPPSVLGAVNNPPTTLSLLAERLTCLELHFDDPTDLDIRMRELGTLSKYVFESATGLEALHVGFPINRPLTLRLDEIFHGLKWNKLSSFGIQAWRLEAKEIIDLARRHQETLRGLRLRDVLLKDGSRWKDVLAVLRHDMKQLNWVSLRRIDYERHYDESRILGAEIPDESLVGSDSSDEDNDWEIPDEDDGYNYHADDLADGSNGSMPDSDVESDIGTDEPEQGGSLHFPLPYPDTPVSTPCCNGGYMDSADALGDDGILVTNSQRKWWERWCIHRICSEHQGHKA